MFFDQSRPVLHTALLVAAVLVAGCAGTDDRGPDTGSAEAVGVRTESSGVETLTTEAVAETSPSSEGAADEDDPALAPGQTPGQDDYNDDGQPDPTCGEQDFGNGLVIRILCDLEGRNSEPPDGVTLVGNSLFRLPTDSDVDLTGISGSAVVGRDQAGQRVFVIVFNSDALFNTGRAEIAGTDTFDNLVLLISREFPGSTLQVRGHTDGTGTDDANLALSQARADNVANYLREHDVDAVDISSIGLGESQPLALEDNDEGKKFNRRVEVVIRPLT
ncbi:MAG: OmpA family protein [Acidimicrobiia bacterium]|nr:OmpA family protein [Acidimicrobiia bacterium]